jgi:hypothetical protein
MYLAVHFLHFIRRACLPSAKRMEHGVTFMTPYGTKQFGLR